LIPAKNNSHGLFKKNFLKLNNISLYKLALLSSLNSNYIYSTFVSSDSKKILKDTEKLGAIPIKRPKNLCLKNTLAKDVVYHFINYIKKEYNLDNFENFNIIYLQPTSPFRSPFHIDEAIKFFKMNKLDSLFTSTKIEDHFIWERKNNKLIANYTFKKRPRRQDIKPKYLENGSFYIFNKNIFIKKKCRLFGKIGTYIQNKKIKRFQIDDEEDLKIINVLFKKFYN
jgi:N-acylneuraminate cytidylyltransferase